MIEPPGKVARSSAASDDAGAQAAAHLGHHVHEQRILRARRRARATSTLPVAADAAEVVALEVDDHHVLGALLGVARSSRRAPVAVPRSRRRVPLIGQVATRVAVDAQEALGRVRHQRPVAAVDVGGERHRVARGQAANSAGGVGARGSGVKRLRQVHLVDVAGGDVVVHARDHGAA